MHPVIIVSKSEMLGPIDYLSDIQNFVSLERAMFADYSLKYNEDIPIFHVYITTFNYMPKVLWTVYVFNIRVLQLYLYMCGQFNVIILHI